MPIKGEGSCFLEVSLRGKVAVLEAQTVLQLSPEETRPPPQPASSGAVQCSPWPRVHCHAAPVSAQAAVLRSHQSQRVRLQSLDAQAVSQLIPEWPTWPQSRLYAWVIHLQCSNYGSLSTSETSGTV